MAKSPAKNTRPDGSEFDGFEEAPQPKLSGAPVSSAGSIADWAADLAKEAELDAVKARRKAENREIRSAAGKHRKKAGKSPAEAEKAEAEKLKAKKTARGTSMGASTNPRDRAAAGLNAVAGLDMSMEEAEASGATSANTATVQALSALIESGNPLFKNGKTEYKPAGDQPTAIADLVEAPTRTSATRCCSASPARARPSPWPGDPGDPAPGADPGAQQDAGRPALRRVQELLPGQRGRVFRLLLRLLPARGLRAAHRHLHREGKLDQRADRPDAPLGHPALLERDDVIIVASVSCIYGIGSVETYTAMTFQLTVGERIDQRQLLADLVALQYKRNDMDFQRGTFRVRGDTIEMFPAHLEDRAWRISLFGDEIEEIAEFDPLTGQKTGDLKSVKIYANSHYVTPRPTLNQAIKSIKAELKQRLAELTPGRLLEAQRLEQRTLFDLEMMRPPAPAPASRTTRAT
jgi:excinuclease ABC subunit B